jgi:outer membrane protein OmpA-like peptidoglycan-associated protein
VVTGCLKERPKLTPGDTMVSGCNESDEYFINHDESFVAHGFDMEKTEYTYTAADIIESLHFEFDSAKISQKEHSKLLDVAKIFTKNKSWCVLVVGHCDKFGGEAYNYSLGQRRAEAARDVLISSGIEGSRIITASLGSSKANRTIQNKFDGEQDRRCDIVIGKM